MDEPIRLLFERLDSLEKAVKLIKGPQVHKQAARNDARKLVNEYFRECRPQFLESHVPEDDLAPTDAGMRDLLDASGKRSAVVTYRKRIKAIRSALVVLDKGIVTIAYRPPTIRVDPTDELILRTLSGLVPTAGQSYEQGLRDLRSADRLSWRGPATDLRECLRETLDHLAPDKDVMATNGFKLEPNARGPTMKQKVRHILRSRGLTKSQIEALDASVDTIDDSVGTFIRSVYTRSSVSTHTHTNREEVLRIRDFVRVALCEILEIRRT